MQQAVDAEADLGPLAPGFDVNVAGPLLVGVLQQPIDDADDVRVVRFRRLAVQFQQLLETGGGGKPAPFPACLGHGAGHAVPLQGVAADVRRVAQHPAKGSAAQGLGQQALPLAQAGLGAGHHHFPVAGGHGQNAVPLGEGVAHDLRDRGNIDLQRLDAQIGLAAALGQPAGEGFQIQLARRMQGIRQIPLRDDLERMEARIPLAARRGEHVRRLAAVNQAIGPQFIERPAQIQPALLARLLLSNGNVRSGCHGLGKVSRPRTVLQEEKNPTLAGAFSA